jgi:hypothetical protein
VAVYISTCNLIGRLTLAKENVRALRISVKGDAGRIQVIALAHQMRAATLVYIVLPRMKLKSTTKK